MPTNEELLQLRKSYQGRSLEASDCLAGPFALFGRWMREAIACGIEEPNAMALATSSATASNYGQPFVRFVLMRAFDERGFVFYTNRESAKGLQIAANPSVSVAFWWKELDRQVRIEGHAERVPQAESEAYFRSRPHGHQISAWASPQSRRISGREELVDREAEAARRFDGQEVPLPDFWGGYRVVPEGFEFWQGRENRLHDRMVFRLQDGDWTLSRLAP